MTRSCTYSQRHFMALEAEPQAKRAQRLACSWAAAHEAVTGHPTTQAASLTSAHVRAEAALSLAIAGKRNHLRGQVLVNSVDYGLPEDGAATAAARGGWSR